MMMLRAPSARLCVWGSARGRGMSGVVAQQQGPAAAQLFSHDSAGYAAFRPCYPQALFQWVGQQLPQWSGLALHGLDVGCGTGQATLPLLQLCGEAGRVTACDGSETQLQQLRLQLRERGEQRVQLLHCAAEQLPPRVQGVHVVTVAQAMHWLDWEAFYAQLDRVLLPGGLLVVCLLCACACVFGGVGADTDAMHTNTHTHTPRHRQVHRHRRIHRHRPTDPPDPQTHGNTL